MLAYRALVRVLRLSLAISLVHVIGRFSGARVYLLRQSDLYFIGFLKHFGRDRRFQMPVVSDPSAE